MIRSAIILGFAGVALSVDPSAPAAAKTLNIVASFTVLADVVAEVGRDHVKVVTLVGPSHGEALIEVPTTSRVGHRLSRAALDCVEQEEGSALVLGSNLPSVFVRALGKDELARVPTRTLGKALV